MKAYYAIFSLVGLFLLRGGMLMAQPANDNCANAINIQNPRNFCSNDRGFTNVASTSAFVASISNCLTNNGNDVWFVFTALATDVRINVFGAVTGSTFGTMRRPEIALYSGTSCDDLGEIGCATDRNSDNTTELYKGGLLPGTRYFIRVQTTAANVGTFKLCVINYNPPAALSSDCITGTVLCDKSPFSVQSITGAGNDTREMDGAACFRNSGSNTNLETNSTWFSWTCERAGTLTFTITPINIDDDIDFVIYELPNANDCSQKRVVRCMATGTTPGPGGCVLHGPTGLREGETDTEELSGCTRGGNQTGFLRPLDMVAGRRYAIVINNFTSTGSGFNIEFGGTGTFQGPVAKINHSDADKKICLGEDIIFTDASTFVSGRIASRKWQFGKGASRDTASGTGPFRVFYKTPGWKSIVLTVTTERNCQVTEILDSIYVAPLQYDSLLRRPTCTGGRDGMIRLRVTNCGRLPIRYNWENTGFTTRDSISNLSPGRYRVAVTDSSGVHIDTFVFELKPFEIELDKTRSAITQPKCFGQSNGRIDLRPVTGIGPYLYYWNGSQFGTRDSFRAALGEGQITVEIRDAQNCKGNYTFDIIQPPPLEVTVDTINISCYGRTDGAAIAYPSGGVGKYSISWSRGDVGDTVRNLSAGRYLVFVRDSNRCEIVSSVDIKEPPQLFVDPSSISPTKCYGDSTGILSVIGRGGTPPYRYSIDGIRFQQSNVFNNIPSRTYMVTVRDSTGCRDTVAMTVPQPPQLQVSAGSDIEISLGFTGELRAVVIPSSKRVSYQWTPKDTTITCDRCPEATIMPVRNTTYRVTVRDSAGCTAFDEVNVLVIKKRAIFAPNAFSPGLRDREGINDYFTIFGDRSAEVIKSLKIFNRWGNLVFEGSNLPMGVPESGWDGTWKGRAVPPDVFAFVAIIRFIDGEEILYKGDVTIMR